MRVHWNTGRQYSANGQRITAEVVESEREPNEAEGFIFKDHDRGISGWVPYPCKLANLDEPEVEAAVMRNYDQGRDYWRFPVWDLERQANALRYKEAA